MSRLSVFSSLPFNVDSFTLLTKGAEAWIYEGEVLGIPVILKKRVPKKYRLPSLDSRLRHQRTVVEAKVMHAVKKQGVNAPFILDVDVTSSSILMEKIWGEKFRDLIYEEKERAIPLFYEFGRSVHYLHVSGVVHGDLTTSNVIITKEKQLFLIDFGLARFSESLEDRAVDLLVIKRTLESTHQDVYDRAWEQFRLGYSSIAKLDSSSILHRLSIIEQRARHVIPENKAFNEGNDMKEA